MDPFLHAIIGEYRILSLLGEGGMGRVYRAQHHRLGRDAAVKILTTAANDPVFLQRFRDEAQIQARFCDPGIASLYDFTEFQGAPVMIMEFIDGETLQEITARLGSWTAAQAIPVLAECARTLEYVHAQGIIHRDLKSANVKISSGGNLKLLDFGIAIPSAGRTVQRLTTAGFVIGTFQSLSPEQVRGEQASQASDIWAFGVLAYEMLTGSLPFEAGSAAELFSKISRAHFTSPSVLKPAVPKALDGVVCRCLKREPKDRYPSFTDLRADLLRLGIQRPAFPEIALNTNAASSPSTRRPWIFAALAVVLLAGGGFGVHSYLASSNDASRSPSQQRMDPTHVPATQDPPDVPRETPVESSGESPLDSSSRTRDLSAQAPASSSNMKSVTVDVLEGSAEVWQDGQKLGTTPYTLQKPFGQTVGLTLKQSGFHDKAVQFDFTERTNYSFEMTRSNNP